MDYWQVLASLSLGVLTSLHPCLALLNLGAFSIISGPLVKPTKMITGGLLFIAGRMAGYTSIAIIFIAGAAFSPHIAQLVRYYAHALMGPLFIVTGMLISGMFGSIRSARTIVHFMPGKGMMHHLGLILLGIIHAISFCPVSAGIFFGILFPLYTESTSIIVNMSFYGFGTGIPLLVILILTAYSKEIASRYSQSRQLIESRIKLFSGVAVILIGIYLTLDRVFNIFS
jgi:cytochrome c biogenesis protein CcdA